MVIRAVVGVEDKPLLGGVLELRSTVLEQTHVEANKCRLGKQARNIILRGTPPSDVDNQILSPIADAVLLQIVDE